MCKTWRPKTRRFLWVCRHHLDVSLRRLLQHVFLCRSASPPTEKWFHMFISSNCFERSNCPTHIPPIQLIKLTRRTHRRGRQIITLAFRSTVSLLAASLQAPPSPYPLYSLLLSPLFVCSQQGQQLCKMYNCPCGVPKRTTSIIEQYWGVAREVQRRDPECPFTAKSRIKEIHPEVIESLTCLNPKEKSSWIACSACGFLSETQQYCRMKTTRTRTRTANRSEWKTPVEGIWAWSKEDTWTTCSTTASPVSPIFPLNDPNRVMRVLTASSHSSS